MAPRPPAKCRTTVLDLDDFLLREVFLRLPALPSLVGAALACRTFLRAVRSSPAFRRSFQALHPSPFVGLFIQRFINGFEPEDSYFDAHHLPTDQDFAAAVRSGDFDLTGLPFPDEDEDRDEEDENDEEEDMEEDMDGEDENSEDEAEEDEEEEENSEEEEDAEAASPVWQIERCCDRVPPRVLVCFYNDFDHAVVGVISSDGNIESEWQKFPDNAIGLTGKMVNGSVYWTNVGNPYMTVIDTVTMQLTKMDLPPLLAERQDDRECAFMFGNTKDGRPCLVSPDTWGDCSLNVFSWRRDEYIDDGLNYWILDQTFPLKTICQFIKFSEGDDEFIILRLMHLIDGVMYLRTAYDRYIEAPPLLLSFCLETAELKMICEDYHKPIHPYNMAWPPSLVLDKGPCSKDQVLCTPGSEGCDVKARGGLIGPASVAKA